MKTNASIRSIVSAVEKVSTEKYKGNLVLTKAPERLTKNVTRFTIKAKDKNKAGALTDVTGKQLPRADAQAHADVISELFNIEGKSTVYVDALNGRQYSPVNHNDAELTKVVRKPRTTIAKTRGPKAGVKRGKYKRKKTNQVKVSSKNNISMKNLVAALREVLQPQQPIAAV